MRISAPVFLHQFLGALLHWAGRDAPANCIFHEGDGKLYCVLNLLKVPVIITMPPITAIYVIISLRGSAHYGKNF